MDTVVCLTEDANHEADHDWWVAEVSVGTKCAEETCDGVGGAP